VTLFFGMDLPRSQDREVEFKLVPAYLEGWVSHYRIRLVYIGLTAGFTRYISNVSGTDKRCRACFFRLSAKHVTNFCL
jgi:hypothetical protein